MWDDLVNSRARCRLARDVEPFIRGHVSRDARPVLDSLLHEEPAVLLEGPRGSGKSTLLREIAAGRDATVVDLDDEAVIAFVQQDPPLP